MEVTIFDYGSQCYAAAWPSWQLQKLRGARSLRHFVLCALIFLAGKASALPLVSLNTLRGKLACFKRPSIKLHFYLR